MLIEPEVIARVVRGCIPVMIFLALDVSAATVWTWVDEQGVKHYSQTPIAGAARVDIGQSNRVPAHVPRAASAPAEPSTAKSTTDVKYGELSIVQPAEDETLHNIAGIVPVKLRIDPALKSNHDVSFYLDDQRVEGVTRTATGFELTGVPRGTHLLVAVIQDEQRKPVQEAAVTFHVRQATALKPKPVQPLPKKN